VTEEALPPEGDGTARAMSRSARYVDVEALAFAIVRALDDRDNGLITEIDTLRRQVAAIAERAGGPDLYVNAIRGEIQALRQEIALLCEEVANLNHAVFQEQSRPRTFRLATSSQSRPRTSVADLEAIQRVIRHEVAPLRRSADSPGADGIPPAASQSGNGSAAVQDAIRTDLAHLIERLNTRSRAEQVVALREEVRAQLGTHSHTEELRSLRAMIVTALSQLRGRVGEEMLQAQPVLNGSAHS
jgi:hypothetical protein